MRTVTVTLTVLALVSLSGCEDEPRRSRRASHETAAEPANLPGDPHMFDIDPSNPHAGQGMGQMPPQGAPERPGAGGLAWTAPAPFAAQPPSSSMRAAEYVFPEEAGETAATLVVFYFGPGQGGQTQANIDRWVGQFQLPAGVEPTVTRRDVNGLQATVVDVTGTFAGGGMGPMNPAGNQAQPSQRMLAGIVEGPQGPVFFKMVGDVSLMSRAEGAFNELVDSVHPG